MLGDLRSLLRIVSALSAVVVLAACTSSGSVKQGNGPELVDNEEALVMPPPGGPAIVGVIGRTRGNGVEQTVSLATSSTVQGQNYFKVAFYGSSGSQNGPAMTYRGLNEGDLLREIARAAPGVPLVRSTAFLQNAYGPFGYAFGRSRGGEACLYGWQQIRSRGTGSGMGRDFGMIQIRVRICDSQATERQLLAVMYGYTVTGGFQGEIWNPYGRPGGVDSRIGQTGQPIYPAAETVPQNISFGYSPPVASTRQSTPVRREVVRETSPSVPVERSNGPRVPLPEIGAAPAAPVQSSPVMAVSGKASGGETVTVPSPDCIGATVMTAACSTKGN